MKIKLIAVGKTDNPYLEQCITPYIKRLAHYTSFEWIGLPDIKNSKSLSRKQQKQKEGELLQKYLGANDYLILLDEKGSTYSSEGFAEFIQKKQIQGIKNLCFVIGGPYGFSDEMYQLSNGLLSLSSMTFSHQMVRLFFVEQLYRAFTILKNEPYHHR